LASNDFIELLHVAPFWKTWMFITVGIASNEHCIFGGKLSIPLAEDRLRNAPMNQLFVRNGFALLKCAGPLESAGGAFSGRPFARPSNRRVPFIGYGQSHGS
jgi:hypothetical protein